MKYRVGKQWLWLVWCGLVLCGAVLGAARADSLWLNTEAPTIRKQAELTPNEEPLSTSIDCEPVVIPNGSSPINACAYKTPIGSLANGYVMDGAKGVLPYDASTGGFVLPSVPNKPNLLLTWVAPRSWSSGVALRSGTYDPSLFRYAEHYGLPTKKVYEYKGLPTNTFKDAINNVINFAYETVAYSQNGNWMLAVASGGGVMRYDLNTMKGKLITWDAARLSGSSNYTKTDSMAVSDDGRYVALAFTASSTGGATRPVLRVYDTTSCRDQYNNRFAGSAINACEYTDVWNGEFRSSITKGVLATVPSAEFPRRVRFMGDGTLTFDTVYDRTGPTNFRVARFSITAPGDITREYVGLLGMGDSYISGEGAAGTYFSGTDTKTNKCHLSWHSYPYRVGVAQFPYGRSVACSGAKMFDVSMAAGDPTEQVNNWNSYKGQVVDKKEWYKREREQIITSFSPGYAQQFIFAEEYKPRTILLSIGGNDINFSGILASCVLTDVSGTCYQYYEDRVQLMQHILGQYDRLVATYKDVAQKSGGRVYVVGYPQVFKEGGNCGANVQLNKTEVKFGAQLLTYLNSVIKRAAAEAGVYYLDTESALTGYRLCEAPSGVAAVNGLTSGNDKTVVLPIYYSPGIVIPVRVGLGNESYHPTAFGHKLLSQAVLKNSANLTAAMPAPRVGNKPSLDYASPLLQGVPHAPEQQRHTEAIRWSTNDTSVLLKNSPYTTNIPKNTLKPGSPIQGILHSEPVIVFEGTYDVSTPLIFRVPDALSLGFHRLDIYGTALDGTSIDLREVVYVAARADDFDDDGTPNSEEHCLLVDPAGMDEDQDGVDDGCDGEIGNSQNLVGAAPELPPSNPEVLAETTEGILVEDGLFMPYIPRPILPVAEDTGVQVAKETGVMSGLPASIQAQISTALQMVALQASAATLSPNFGTVLTPDEVSSPLQAAAAPVLASAVLGEGTARYGQAPEARVSTDPQPKHGSMGIYLFAVGLAAFFLFLVAFRHRKHKLLQ